MTLRIYLVAENATSTDWDKIIEKGEYTIVDEFEGETNRECETKAEEKYGDTDIYMWLYE